jgi:hypothetical protein
MRQTDLMTICAEVSDLLEARLSARGRTLEDRVRSARRRLPREVRRAALFLAETEARCRNPRLAQQMDAEAVAAAHATCLRHLEPLGAAERRAARLYGWAAALSVNLLLLAAAVLAWLRWRGLL